MTEETIVTRGEYLHYKGGKYWVMEIVLNATTDEPMVMYHPLYDPTVVFVRTLSDFKATVGDVPRFKMVYKDEFSEDALARFNHKYTR